MQLGVAFEGWNDSLLLARLFALCNVHVFMEPHSSVERLETIWQPVTGICVQNKLVNGRRACVSL